MQPYGTGSSPQISVLTPTFNYARFLRDAVASVASQRNVEASHVIQDGASSDESSKAIAGFDVDWESAPDSGQSDALNRALERAEAPWVSWLNADEFYLPDGLCTLIAGAEERGLDVAYGDAVLVNEQGVMTKLLPQHPFHETILRWYGPFPSTCATVFRKEVLGETPWDVSLRTVMDWDLYLRLRSMGATFGYVPTPVGAFRLHAGQVSAQLKRARRAEGEAIRARYNVRWRTLEHAGHLWHWMEKATSGSYLRQVRARRFHGKDFRWFLEEIGTAAPEALIRYCYP